jgi:anaerobic dimethyl sulfoxide reductase subunit B (iron-sulfur subunit)
MANQLAFYVDIAACTGCKACQIACKDRSDLPVGIRWRRVFEYSGGEWVPQGGLMIPSNVFAYFVSAACMHCQNPLCRDVCPTGAITKREDGIVLINQDKCIGCRYCQWACPYGAPQFDSEQGVMTKCDFCYDLQAKGEDPACVAGCPYRALDYGPLDELRAKYGTLADPAPLPDPSITRPAVVYGPSLVTQTSAQATGEIMNVEEVQG